MRLSFPVKCRRAGLELDSDNAIEAYVAEMHAILDPAHRDAWRADAASYWAGSRSDVTKPIFDRMAADFGWYTYNELPSTSNPARWLQDLKEAGFTIGTRRRMGSDLEFMLVPKLRGDSSGYEYWSGALRTRIVATLRSYDAYEGKSGNPRHLLPDHKFPEARWNRDTCRDSLDHLTAPDILADFQLVTNQRNQQKREVCRTYVQTGVRDFPFGIPFYHVGHALSPDDVPRSGKATEKGCIGCGWYDLEAWRTAVRQALAMQ